MLRFLNNFYGWHEGLGGSRLGLLRLRQLKSHCGFWVVLDKLAELGHDIGGDLGAREGQLKLEICLGGRFLCFQVVYLLYFIYHISLQSLLCLPQLIFDQTLLHQHFLALKQAKLDLFSLQDMDHVTNFFGCIPKHLGNREYIFGYVHTF